MVRGRAGATGAPFNLGEMTVIRCALRLGCGTVGHAWLMGRRKPCAEAAAPTDALMQTGVAGYIRSAVPDPLKKEPAEIRQVRAEKASATKVDLFSRVRGGG